MNYVRVSYRSQNHGYFQDINDDWDKEVLSSVAEICRKKGALPPSDRLASTLVSSLMESELCPPIFRQEPILGVYVETRMLSTTYED